jgi:MFS superfamily sulfate permease-like transporter
LKPSLVQLRNEQAAAVDTLRKETLAGYELLNKSVTHNAVTSQKLLTELQELIHAVWKNINLRKISQYRSITTLDYVTAIVAMVGVLAFGLLEGLLLAAFLGLIALLVGMKRKNTFVLGMVSETGVYRSLQNYPAGETYPGLLLLRFDGTLFFANAHDFITAARRAIAEAQPSPTVVVLDGESLNDIDATAVITLKEFQSQLAQSGVQLRLARIKTHVMVVMERGGLTEVIAAEHLYPTVQTAVDAYLAEKNLTAIN